MYICKSLLRAFDRAFWHFVYPAGCNGTRHINPRAGDPAKFFDGSAIIGLNFDNSQAVKDGRNQYCEDTDRRNIFDN